MKQIRRGVFETNSSSTHSMTMCSGDVYDKWKRGEVFFCGDTWGSDSEYAKMKWVTLEQARDILAKCKYYDGIAPDKLDEKELIEACREADIEIRTFDNYGSDYLEFFSDEFVTPGGERVIAFGEYGYDS